MFLTSLSSGSSVDVREEEKEGVGEGREKTWWGLEGGTLLSVVYKGQRKVSSALLIIKELNLRSCGVRGENVGTHGCARMLRKGSKLVRRRLGESSMSRNREFLV